MAKAFLIRGGVEVSKGGLEASRDHTCATLLLSRGVLPKFVQELLGHPS
jgi:site-specific recombinase XerD